MDPSATGESLWSESDSQHFIDVGEIHTPNRDEIQKTILDLIPAESDEAFTTIELGVGDGWLSAALLHRFPRAHVLGLDGSLTMLRETGTRLQQFGDRYELRQFRLEDMAWMDELTVQPRCFVSSLVIHHLDGPLKEQLYRRMYSSLDDRGAVIIADIVAPTSECERRYMAKWWNAEVERQSREMRGSLDVYQRFVSDQSNWFEYPDPMDMPSSVPEHLRWLGDCGFQGVDVFWARAGHAVYGGFKSISD